MTVCTAANGIWTRDRLFKAGMVDDNICPRCGVAVETAYHRYWECPDNKNVENRIAMRASESLRDTAPKGSAQLTRGIPPISAYPDIEPPPGSYWKEGKWNLASGKVVSKGAFSSSKGGIVIFTDGSGALSVNKKTKKPALALCGNALLLLLLLPER